MGKLTVKATTHVHHAAAHGQNKIHKETRMQFSQTYYNTLTPMQHAANNAWFAHMLSYLKEDGVLYVPVLDKRFNKQGEEIK